jgi:hypothetical protein
MTLLISVMVVCGLIGGFANYVRLPADQTASGQPLLRAVTLGVIASFVVPLFLSLAKSTLTDNAAKAGAGPDLLVFSGFCLVAALYSSTFLDTLAERILQQVRKEAREVKQDKDAVKQAKAEVVEIADEVESQVSEPADTDASIPLATGRSSSFVGPTTISDSERHVLDALANAQWRYRSLSGIAKDTQMGTEDARRTLESLVDRGLVGRRTGRDSEEKWFITGAGRNARK